jgi:carbonic anhydrase
MSKAEEMLSCMMDGNLRYVSKGGKSHLSHFDRRPAEAQQPQATILECSDLRAFPEQVFGLNAGDLNILQTAACVCSNPEAGFSDPRQRAVSWSCWDTPHAAKRVLRLVPALRRRTLRWVA